MIIITLTCIVTKNKFRIYCVDVKNIYAHFTLGKSCFLKTCLVPVYVLVV